MELNQETLTDQAALTLEADSDGVAWLTFDRPESSVNLLTSGVMARLDSLLDELEERVTVGRVKALIVRSGKPGTFIAGADVTEIAAIGSSADGAAKAAEGQRVFRRLENLPIPSIAAIDGLCLGGGTELVLACRYRIASDSPGTRIGLPEVRLGIIPGFGGTVRLPRLIGLAAAVEMIVTGRPVSASKAERLGLIDELVPRPALEDRVRRFAWERIDRGPGRTRRPARRFGGRLLDDTAPGRRLVLWQAKRKVVNETRGHYPAPVKAVDVLGSTLAVPLTQAFAIEADAVGRLLATDTCKNLLHVFALTEQAKKAMRGVGTAATPPLERLAVLGAGTMGGAIAQLLAHDGIAVRLKDISPEAIGLGLRHASELFDGAVSRRRLTRSEARQRMELIAPTLDYSGFGTVELVIEAVVEQPEVKKSVLREVEERVRPDVVLASNTSSLSINELGRHLERPEQFCGMHFFNPVHRMPLVEIVRGEATSDNTVAAVFALARKLDKTPLVVNDSPGFLVNRVLAPYLNEAGWLLAEGVSIDAIDRALVEFGMPMGPLRLLDEVGLDVARHAAGVIYEAFGERLRPAPPLIALGETTRLGRKGGAGFYRYDGRKEPSAGDETIYAELRNAVPAERKEVPSVTIRQRCVLAMVNEAARVLEDGVVGDAGAVDLGMVMGTGFPPFRGGLLRYADSIGTGTVLEELEHLSREHGPRFEPAPLLRERAAANRGFYD